MRTAGHLAFAFTILCLGAGISIARRLWHDRTSQFDHPWATWPLGERRWRGFVRAFPTFAVGNFVSVALGWALAALEAGPGHESAVALLSLATAAAFMLTMGLTALITATGRPARLVPPHLRARGAGRDGDRPTDAVTSG
jgi:hypothetical protein